MNDLPPAFIRTVSTTFADGPAWLGRLPALIAEIEARWNVRIEPPFPNLSYNYAAPAIRADGSPAVVKIGVPNAELLSEMAALHLYDGRGIARLLEHDAARGALLLERLRPGTTLLGMADDEHATVIAAQVMRALWQPVNDDHPFPTVELWARDLITIRDQFGGTAGPFPERLVDLAQTLLRDLLAAPTGRVLLHADLHHDNILQAERAPWLAIDPKGVAGEPEYEVGTFLHNPHHRIKATPDLGRVLARRIAIFAEQLGFDRQRLAAWGVVNAMLSAAWSADAATDPWVSDTVRCAEAMAELL